MTRTQLSIIFSISILLLLGFILGMQAYIVSHKTDLERQNYMERVFPVKDTQITPVHADFLKHTNWSDFPINAIQNANKQIIGFMTQHIITIDDHDLEVTLFFNANGSFKDYFIADAQYLKTYKWVFEDSGIHRLILHNVVHWEGRFEFLVFKNKLNLLQITMDDSITHLAQIANRIVERACSVQSALQNSMKKGEA